MSKNLDKLKSVLVNIETRSHITRERLNLRDADAEEKIRCSLMYDAKASGVIEAAMYFLSIEEYDILCHFAGKLKLV